MFLFWCAYGKLPQQIYSVAGESPTAGEFGFTLLRGLVPECLLESPCPLTEMEASAPHFLQTLRPDAPCSRKGTPHSGVRTVPRVSACTFLVTDSPCTSASTVYASDFHILVPRFKSNIFLSLHLHSNFLVFLDLPSG